jgi:predicted nucleic acid-binding protein
MLVDTSVWVDHFRRGNDTLAALLEGTRAWSHPFVVGELACGHLKRRREILAALAALPHAPLVNHSEVLAFLEREQLMGRGLGWVDMHLLASAMHGDLVLWTLDRRLAAIARQVGVAANP